MPLIDITRPLSAGTAAWPGDTPTTLTRNAALADGASVNLSSITASVHNATHVDAPLHYDDAGCGIEGLDLDLYLGECEVVDVVGHDPILPEHLPIDLPPRVLLKTGGWPESGTFPNDVPSVDKPTSKTLPIHHAIHAAGLRILESFDLANVEAGRYELIALPILIPGSDGAFVRAVLRHSP
ncbi:MAG: cyclase family protein [Planctomycetota bacterium]